MTHSDPTPSRKPRRGGLVLPFVLAALVCIAWSVGWFYLRNEMIKRMDATSAHLKAEGYDLSWTRREVTGFPFASTCSWRTPESPNRPAGPYARRS